MITKSGWYLVILKQKKVGLILITPGNTSNARLGKVAGGMEMREIKKGAKLCLVYLNQIF